jgi:hypothetical protein
MGDSENIDFAVGTAILAAASLEISTSGLVSAMIDFPLPVWRDDIVLGHNVMGDPEKIDYAVEITILTAQQA